MGRCGWDGCRRGSTAGSRRARSTPSSDCMDLRDRTAMILGGSGLVGHAVARRLLAAAPGRLVLVALFEEEVRATARALDPYRGRAAIEVEWGNVFLPGSLAQLERGAVVANPDQRRLMLQDLLSELTDDVLQRSFLYQLLVKYKPDAVVDAINTATAFAYQDPVESAQELLALATAGKVDRAAVERPEPVPASEAFRPGAHPWCDLGKPLQGVYIDVGENGLFSSDEFETVTALGQMEFITPEEVAEYAVLELEGRPTGRDVVAALDGATAGPTYRAGLLRAHALDRLRALERQLKTRTVAYEMLGPPRLTKLLFESYICGQLRSSVRALAESHAGDLAQGARALVERDGPLRSHILSVGIAILAPDGERVYRGSTVVVGASERVGSDPREAAPRGWVDLRPEQFGLWIARAREMLAQAERRRNRAADSGSDVDWTALGADDPIEPARFATWVFRYEDRGERIKR